MSSENHNADEVDQDLCGQTFRDCHLNTFRIIGTYKEHYLLEALKIVPVGQKGCTTLPGGYDWQGSVYSAPTRGSQYCSFAQMKRLGSVLDSLSCVKDRLDKIISPNFNRYVDGDNNLYCILDEYQGFYALEPLIITPREDWKNAMPQPEWPIKWQGNVYATPEDFSSDATSFLDMAPIGIVGDDHQHFRDKIDEIVERDARLSRNSFFS